MGSAEKLRAARCISFLEKARHGFSMASTTVAYEDPKSQDKALEWADYGHAHLERFYLDLEEASPYFGPRDALRLAKELGKASREVQRYAGRMLKGPSRIHSGAATELARQLADESQAVSNWAEHLASEQNTAGPCPLGDRELDATTSKSKNLLDPKPATLSREAIGEVWRSLGPVGQPIAIGVMVAVPLILGMIVFRAL